MVRKKQEKKKELFINIAIQEAFRIFLENEKSIDFEYDYDEYILSNYTEPIEEKLFHRKVIGRHLLKLENTLIMIFVHIL